VSTCLSTCVSMCVRVREKEFVRMCVRVHVSLYVCMCVCMCACVCMCVGEKEGDRVCVWFIRYIVWCVLDTTYLLNSLIQDDTFSTPSYLLNSFIPYTF